ncbi:MAG: hypothetical protein M0Z30_22380, partial [Actinomycetota bacterium]|nr:hypothetical protein [Actinomycetota bacterium]
PAPAALAHPGPAPAALAHPGPAQPSGPGDPAVPASGGYPVPASGRSGALPVPAAPEASPNESRFESAPVLAPASEVSAINGSLDGGLPRRIPGATLGDRDETLRRDRTPAPQTPWAVSYALTDYLNNRAEPPSGRPPTEG